MSPLALALFVAGALALIVVAVVAEITDTWASPLVWIVGVTALGIVAVSSGFMIGTAIR